MRNHDRNMVRHRRRRWNCRDVNTVVARGATRKSIKRKRPPKNRKNARRRPGAGVAEPTRFSISFEIDRIEALLKKREIVTRDARNASRHFRAASTGGKIRGFILLRNGNGLPMLNNRQHDWLSSRSKTKLCSRALLKSRTSECERFCQKMPVTFYVHYRSSLATRKSIFLEITFCESSYLYNSHIVADDQNY